MKAQRRAELPIDRKVTIKSKRHCGRYESHHFEIIPDVILIIDRSEAIGAEQIR
ncbi:hypothetical protein [Providencia hangzhouensis]|uniref:hypothetical protein n=1 Tax=Providencia hangzhouensis TaxID=3031799 RepID=UPI0034DDB3BA